MIKIILFMNLNLLILIFIITFLFIIILSQHSNFLFKFHLKILHEQILAMNLDHKINQVLLYRFGEKK